MGPPDIVDGRFADALTLGHRPAAPMRHSFGFGLQGCFHDGGNLVALVGGFPPASRRNLLQSIQPPFGKALAPQNDCLAIDGQLLGNGHVRLALGCCQYNPTA